MSGQRELFDDTEVGPRTLLPASVRPGAKLRATPAPPGTGPAGETCKTCRFLARSGGGGRRYFLKCGLMRADWTHGPGTDVRAGWAACREWQASSATGGYFT